MSYMLLDNGVNEKSNDKGNKNVLVQKLELTKVKNQIQVFKVLK